MTSAGSAPKKAWHYLTRAIAPLELRRTAHVGVLVPWYSAESKPPGEHTFISFSIVNAVSVVYTVLDFLAKSIQKKTVSRLQSQLSS